MKKYSYQWYKETGDLQYEMGKNTEHRRYNHNIRKSIYETIPYKEHLCFPLGRGW